MTNVLETTPPASTPPADFNRRYSYQEQYRKCNKARCGTCNSGNGHGPYWYAYYRDGSKIRSVYLGNHDPRSIGVNKALAELEAERERKRQAREEKKAAAAARPRRRVRRKKSSAHEKKSSE